MKYIWEMKNNPDKIKFRKEFDLDSVIEKGKDEFEKQLLLKDWTHNSLLNGKPCKDYSAATSFEILEDAKNGKSFWCTQYSQVFISAGVALDYYVRKLGVDCEDPKLDMHHGICDIWSNQFQKWYVVDPQNNLHYEKSGIPLNSLEIRNEYLLNYGRDICGIIGNHERKIKYNKDSKGFNTPSNYFWFFIALRNNFFEKPGIYDFKALLWIDKYNKDKIWQRNGGNEIHPMYKSQFIETSNINDCFPLYK